MFIHVLIITLVVSTQSAPFESDPKQNPICKASTTRLCVGQYLIAIKHPEHLETDVESFCDRLKNCTDEQIQCGVKPDDIHKVKIRCQLASLTDSITFATTSTTEIPTSTTQVTETTTSGVVTTTESPVTIIFSGTVEVTTESSEPTGATIPTETIPTTTVIIDSSTTTQGTETTTSEVVTETPTTVPITTIFSGTVGVTTESSEPAEATISTETIPTTTVTIDTSNGTPTTPFIIFGTTEESTPTVTLPTLTLPTDDPVDTTTTSFVTFTPQEVTTELATTFTYGPFTPTVPSASELPQTTPHETEPSTTTPTWYLPEYPSIVTPTCVAQLEAAGGLHSKLVNIVNGAIFVAENMNPPQPFFQCYYLNDQYWMQQGLDTVRQICGEYDTVLLRDRLVSTRYRYGCDSFATVVYTH